MVPAIVNAKPGKEQAVEVTRLLEFLARKTEVTLDDDVIRLVQNILLTPEGGALVDYLVRLIGGLAEQASYEQIRPDRT